MTIGQVLAVIGLIVGLGICSWAVMVCVALLFNRKCTVAKEAIANSPWASLAVGVFAALTLGVMSVALINPASPAKPLGYLLLTLLLAAVALGAGGFSLLAGSRIRMMDEQMTDYQALTRGAAVVFIAGLTPVLGTFLLAPVGVLMALGSGIRSLFHKEAVPSLEAA